MIEAWYLIFVFTSSSRQPVGNPVFNSEVQCEQAFEKLQRDMPAFTMAHSCVRGVITKGEK
jgi:hypothetical protein